MARATLPALILLGCASASWAQDDALLPTHLIDGGQVYVTGNLQYLGGQGDADILSNSGDFDLSIFSFEIDAGIGLGSNFEIDASITYQFIGKTNADFSSSSTEFETEEVGFSDLLLNPRFAILKDSTVTPQLIVGAIAVAPVGNDKDGQTEITSGGTVTQPGEEGGIGDGVWRYGLQAGVSKRLAVLEPYLLAEYLLADDRKKDGVKEEPGDVLNLTIGARWHLGPTAILDTRLLVTRTSKAKEETSGTQTEEEAHLVYGGQLALYLKVGPGAYFTIGAGLSSIEDHEVNDALQMEIKDNLNWFAGIGLHILFGGGDEEKQ
jgi:hypothetical protein